MHFFAQRGTSYAWVCFFFFFSKMSITFLKYILIKYNYIVSPLFFLPPMDLHSFSNEWPVSSLLLLMSKLVKENLRKMETKENPRGSENRNNKNSKEKMLSLMTKARKCGHHLSTLQNAVFLDVHFLEEHEHLCVCICCTKALTGIRNTFQYCKVTLALVCNQRFRHKLIKSINSFVQHKGVLLRSHNTCLTTECQTSLPTKCFLYHLYPKSFRASSASILPPHQLLFRPVCSVLQFSGEEYWDCMVRGLFMIPFVLINLPIVVRKCASESS